MNTKSMIDRMIGAAESKGWLIDQIALSQAMADTLTGQEIKSGYYRHIPLIVAPHNSHFNVRLRCYGGAIEYLKTEDDLTFNGLEWTFNG